jgi:thiamine biosynthesis protein ThiI
MRTLLYRRMMIRIAERVAAKAKAQALVTGEAIGQVASQTLENLSTVNGIAKLPILRPLVGFDKEDIIRLAQHYGTYETSIRPADDCCTLFADRHPTLRGTESLVQEQEAKLDIPALVEEAIGLTYRKKLPS